MSKPTMFAGPREFTVSDRVAEAYGSGVSGEADDVWLEQVLEGGQWIAAARIVADSRGLAAIAELRVFPNEPDRPDFPGRWNAEAFGLAARHVPTGGLPARLLRRKVPLGDIEAQANVFLASLDLLSESIPGASPSVKSQGVDLRAAGFSLRTRERAERFAKLAGDVGSRRGRKPTMPAVYARFASDYITFVERKQAPIPALARQHRMTPAAVRSTIARARREGFLSQAPRHGTGGGVLTQKSIALLARLPPVSADAPAGARKATRVSAPPVARIVREPRKKKKRADH